MADEVPPSNSTQSQAQSKASEAQSQSKSEAPSSQSQAQSQAAPSQSQAGQSQAQVQPSQTQSSAEPRTSQSQAQPPPSATPSEPQQSQSQAQPQASTTNAEGRSGSVAPELQNQGQAGAASTSTTVGKRGSRKSDKGDSNELIKKEAKKDDKTPADLAGTLQNLFTQTEQAEAPVLKPLRRPKLIYENTFRLWSYKPFNNDNVQSVVEITLEEMLGKVKYKADTSNDLAMKVAERVRSRVLSFRFDRCKIIVLVHLGPLYRQGLHVGMKCLWDPLRDTYVSHNFKNTYIYCNCCVYGIYFE